MRLDDDARQYIYADLTLTVDPTDSTVVLKVDDTDHAMVWQGDSVQTAPEPAARWTQTARTVEKFCGSAVTPGPDVQLTVGRHLAQVIVSTADGQELPASQFDINVR